MYPDIEYKLYIKDQPFTAELAKKTLGWWEETENLPLDEEHGGKDWLDRNGKRVKLTNNVSNRPISPAIVDTLMQVILRRRWVFNGEPLILGTTALVLNGQHTCLALISAVQEWEKHPGQWKEYWQEEPTIEKALICGIDENDRTVNTMDTARPRTLSDVVYRSEFFKDTPKRYRRIAARATDYAVRLLWSRTGAGGDGNTIRRTHDEAVNFISRHYRLLECVRHVIQEDHTDRKIGRYISVGYASALMYLMGSAATDREAPHGYSNVTEPSEAQIDWSLWDKASNFWVELAQSNPKMNAVREVLGNLLIEGSGSMLGSRCALLIKAWNLYSEGKKITPVGIALEYTKDANDGGMILAEVPIVGGIDLGGPT